MTVSRETQMGGEPPATTSDPLVVALYGLLRDHVAPGDMEQVVLGIEKCRPGFEFLLTNGYLAGYAENIARRLRIDKAPVGSSPHDVTDEAERRISAEREILAALLKSGIEAVNGLLRREKVTATDHETDKAGALEWVTRAQEWREGLGW